MSVFVLKKAPVLTNGVPPIECLDRQPGQEWQAQAYNWN